MENANVTNNRINLAKIKTNAVACLTVLHNLSIFKDVYDREHFHDSLRIGNIYDVTNTCCQFVCYHTCAQHIWCVFFSKTNVQIEAFEYIERDTSGQLDQHILSQKMFPQTSR